MPPAASFCPFSRSFSATTLLACLSASFYLCCGVFLFTIHPIVLMYDSSSPFSIVRLSWSSFPVSFPIFIPHYPLVVVVEVVEMFDECWLAVTMELSVLLEAFPLYALCSRKIVDFVCVHRFFLFLRLHPLSALFGHSFLPSNLTSLRHSIIYCVKNILYS
jgi:hypothetical protein